MSDAKQLLEKIAALRVRLDAPPPPPDASADPAVAALAARVQHGAWHSALLDRTLRPLDPAASPDALPARLTARGARLLKKGRELLQALRALADDPLVPGDDPLDPLATLRHETAALLDAVLRTVQAFPPAPSAQLRLCEGLEVALAGVEEQVGTLTAGLVHRRDERGRVDGVADILRHLAAGQPIGLGSLQRHADQVLDDARAGRPLRFLAADPADPARFAAAHGLTVAAVLARLLLDDAEWQTRLEVAVMAALVHDAGMVRLPPEVLAKPGPLTDDERRLVERHAALGGPLVAPLWPGGGWPVEAATDHHERLDGTGYPQGRKEIGLAPFVRLLAVCDVYAALCCSRPHRPALDPRTALTDTLLLADHDRLDKAWAERLLRLSFYPVGSAVLLDDGAVAVVVATHPGPAGLAQPARPVVQRVTAAAGQPLALPAVVDLLARRDRSIVRGLTRAERRQVLGRKYPELV